MHMRLMAEHKYGVRVTSNVGWEGFFEKLGHAAVTFDLLQNKIHRSVTVTLNDTNSSSSKGNLLPAKRSFLTLFI